MMTTARDEVGILVDPAEDLPRTGTRVELVSLVRRYGTVRALDGFSITIEPGELLALLGPSGCGKTTVLRTLAGFERADSGRVLVGGRDVARTSPQRRDMGMVFQSYSLFPNMTALNNVAFGLRMRRQRASRRRAKSQELLEMVGLGDQAAKYPHQMSGGQQQRVALARALAIEPSVLLLDEPLSALDAQVRVELREQIRELQQRLAITTLFVTHDQEEALSLADRVCVMSAGHNEQTATPSELYSRPLTPFVAEFVGTVSRVPVRVDGASVELFGQRLPVRTSTLQDGSAEADALLRPEDVSVSVDPDARGFVTRRSFHGAVTRLTVQVEELAFKVDVRSEDAVDLDYGTRVAVRVLARDVLVAPRRAGAVSA